MTAAIAVGYAILYFSGNMTGRLTDRQTFLLVLSVVLLSRLPFLATTLGTDADVYRVALTGLTLARDGVYSVSRFPAFPVQEFTFALLAGAQPVLLNLLSAVLSGIAAAACALLVRRHTGASGFLPGLALAATPIVFVHSTTAMDYVWALAAILGGLVLIPRRPAAAGLLLGLAIACRFTSAVFLIPFLLALGMSGAGPRVRPMLVLTGSALLTAAAFYLPAWLVFVPQPGPLIPVVTARSSTLFKATAGVWGVPGAVAAGTLGVLVVLRLLRIRKEETPVNPPAGRPLMIVSLVSVALVLLTYAFHPYEAGYLIPAVPFLVLLLTRGFGVRGQVVFLAVLLLSGFSLGVLSTHQPERLSVSALAVRVPGGPVDAVLDPLTGPVLLEYERREARRTLIDALFAYADTAARPAVVITGWLTPQIRYELGGSDTRGRVRFAYALRETALRQYAGTGQDIFMLRGMREMNVRRYDTDPATFGGREFTIPGAP